MYDMLLDGSFDLYLSRDPDGLKAIISILDPDPALRITLRSSISFAFFLGIVMNDSSANERRNVMNQDELTAIFDQQAPIYDQMWIKTAPILDALHLLTRSILPMDSTNPTNPNRISTRGYLTKLPL